MVKTDSAALGAVIENRNVTGLPLDGRNFYELALLVPGVAAGGAGLGRRGARRHRAQHQWRARGLEQLSARRHLQRRSQAQHFRRDAAGGRDPEFEVLTSVYDASFGRNAGGQVNVVLKSGSNNLHGSAYEFFRNGALDARNFFAPSDQPQAAVPAQPVRRIGGRADPQEPHVLLRGLRRPPRAPGHHAGEQCADAGRARRAIFRRQRPGAHQSVHAAAVSRKQDSVAFCWIPPAASIAALYPTPNRAVPGQNFVSSPVERDRDDHFDVRLDHSLAPSSDLSFRYSFADRNLFDPFSGAGFALVPGYGDNVPRRAQNVMLGETHTFSPSMINELRAGYNRVSAGSFQQNMGPTSTARWVCPSSPLTRAISD